VLEHSGESRELISSCAQFTDNIQATSIIESKSRPFSSVALLSLNLTDKISRFSRPKSFRHWHPDGFLEHRIDCLMNMSSDRTNS